MIILHMDALMAGLRPKFQSKYRLAPPYSLDPYEVYPVGTLRGSSTDVDIRFLPLNLDW